ncbi:unnamed protein product [Enterobius vermicularis]|uniref:Carbonic anhydrase n=1 Tax=Enterobius vermicularis TaxID=51028 RepID=A0A0N4V5S3_ENTVE|nr:unnamed protein product [Enterobius vermicularis]
MSTFGKFLKGVLQFRKSVRAPMVKKIQEVTAHGHASAVMYACMDARIKPLRSSLHLGEIYIVRNAGNMIPIGETVLGGCGHEVSPIAEPAGLDLTVKLGKIKHVIVCGHSDCAVTLYDIYKNPNKFNMNSPLHHWLEQRGNESLKKLEHRIGHGPEYNFDAKIDAEEKLTVQDKLSQINTLQQVENITSHNFLAEILEQKQVNLHALWFELKTGDLHMFSKANERYVVVGEENINDLIHEVEK